MITSPQNPRVKEVARLRDARHRRRAGRYLIDGARELLRAIESRVALETVFYCRELCRTADSQAVLARLDALNVERCEVAPRVLEKLPDRIVMLAAASTMTLALAALALSWRGHASSDYWGVILTGWVVLGIAYSASITPGGRLLRHRV